MTRKLTSASRYSPSARRLLSAIGAPDLAEVLPDGVAREELITEARHQADLLAHPYVGPEHVQLAALRLSGRREDWARLHAALSPGLRNDGWRPRGALSAARRRGRRQAVRRQTAAADNEARRPWPNA
jgi:hypothetical protein